MVQLIGWKNTVPQCFLKKNLRMKLFNMLWEARRLLLSLLAVQYYWVPAECQCSWASCDPFANRIKNENKQRNCNYIENEQSQREIHENTNTISRTSSLSNYQIYNYLLSCKTFCKAFLWRSTAKCKISLRIRKVS